MTKMIGLTVRLSSVEKRLCEYVTKVRIKTNRSNNVSEKKISKDEELQLELEGYGAELAFCRLFNVFPDTSTQGLLKVTQAMLSFPADVRLMSKQPSIQTVNFLRLCGRRMR